MRSLPSIDATGIRVLDDLCEGSVRNGVASPLAGLHAQPLAALDRAGPLDPYRRQNFAGDPDDGLARARETLPRGGGAPSGQR